MRARSGPTLESTVSAYLPSPHAVHTSRTRIPGGGTGSSPENSTQREDLMYKHWEKKRVFAILVKYRWLVLVFARLSTIAYA